MFANYSLWCLWKASSYVNIILKVQLLLFIVNRGERGMKRCIKMPKCQNSIVVFVQKGWRNKWFPILSQLVKYCILPVVLMAPCWQEQKIQTPWLSILPHGPSNMGYNVSLTCTLIWNSFLTNSKHALHPPSATAEPTKAPKSLPS